MNHVSAVMSPQVFTGVARTKKGAEHLASDAAMRYIAAIPPKSVSSSPSGMAPVHFDSAASPMNPSPSPVHPYQPPQHQTPPRPQKVRCHVILRLPRFPSAFTPREARPNMSTAPISKIATAIKGVFQLRLSCRRPSIFLFAFSPRGTRPDTSTTPGWLVELPSL